MKIRNGFVSNSSSSSFVIVMTSEVYCKALEGLDKEVKEMVEYWAKIGKVGKESVVYFSDMTDMGGHSIMFSSDDDYLYKFKDYVDEKFGGDFGAIFHDDFLDKIDKKDYLNISNDM